MHWLQCTHRRINDLQFIDPKAWLNSTHPRAFRALKRGLEVTTTFLFPRARRRRKRRVLSFKAVPRADGLGMVAPLSTYPIYFSR